jgi:hypothetical protein
MVGSAIWQGCVAASDSYWESVGECYGWISNLARGVDSSDSYWESVSGCNGSISHLARGVAVLDCHRVRTDMLQANRSGRRCSVRDNACS